jgi:hypothetical protein
MARDRAAQMDSGILFFSGRWTGTEPSNELHLPIARRGGYGQPSPRFSPPLGVQAWYHVNALIVGARLRTLPSANATFMAACAVEANSALHWLAVPPAGLRGWT